MPFLFQPSYLLFNNITAILRQPEVQYCWAGFPYHLPTFMCICRRKLYEIMVLGRMIQHLYLSQIPGLQEYIDRDGHVVSLCLPPTHMLAWYLDVVLQGSYDQKKFWQQSSYQLKKITSLDICVSNILLQKVRFMPKGVNFESTEDSSYPIQQDTPLSRQQYIFFLLTFLP